MKILFLMLIAATWVLGTYDGDHTAAVGFSLWGACAWVYELKERKAKAVFVDYETAENCCNDDSFGVVCVKCEKCGSGKGVKRGEIGLPKN